MSKQRRPSMMLQPGCDENDPMEIFDLIEENIRKIFFSIIEELISRRDELLEQLNLMKQDCKMNDQTRKQSKRELEILRKQMETFQTDSPSASEFQKSCIEKLDRDLKNFEVSVVPNLVFTCDNLDIDKKIKVLGEVRNASDFYQSKNQPIYWKGHKGSRLNEYSSPKAVTLDNTKDILYIADSENKRIVICSKYGEQISEITENLKSPYGVTLGGINELYVTDTAKHALLKYSLINSDLVYSVTKFGNSKDTFNYPKGLDTDSKGQIFIADSRNNRVVVLGPQFELRGIIGKDVLKEPFDVKVRQDKRIYVLDRSQEKMHIFSVYGIKESTRINLTSMFQPMFFAFDNRNNVIVSDYHDGCVKIFGQDGLLLQKIGKQGNNKGEFVRATGVAITEEGWIIVMSENPWFPLQIF